jgi:NADH-quinone oxidoreductase subunit M
MTICIIGIIYTSLTTLRKTDFKKIIAYSSVAHMGFVVIGMFSLTVQGIEGSVILMLSHGLVSSALFLMVGIIYDRHHTRVLKYYCGITQGMPIFATGFLFFSLANLGLPGTSSFVGEFLVLIGALYHNTTVAVMISTAVILSAAYSIWFFNRIAMGKRITTHLKTILDVSRREVFVIIPFIFLTLLMGIYPEVFIDSLHTSLKTLLTNAHV